MERRTQRIAPGHAAVVRCAYFTQKAANLASPPWLYPVTAAVRYEALAFFFQ